jgi:hypothetical protein
MVVVAGSVVGCQTDKVIMDQVPASAGGRLYLLFEDKVDSDNILAIMSYTSSGLSQSTNIDTIEDVEIFFSYQFDQIMDQGVIHSNYPVKPTYEETHIARRFMDVWIFNAYLQDYGGGDAAFVFSQDTQQFIEILSNKSYRDYAISNGLIVVTNKVE